jgi:flagellar motility protein MotE (MotC chaperone)
MTARPRALPVLAGLLAVAAVLKAASGIGGAMAQIPSPEPVALQVASPALAQRDPQPGVSPELLLDLRRREQDLDARLTEIAAREQALRDAEGQIVAQIAALEAAERELSATMALADRAAETDLARLTAVFEAMRPEQAAQVVAEMAPDFAAGLVARLRPETAAAILAGLEPRLAYGLSAILAGRNATVPRR